MEHPNLNPNYNYVMSQLAQILLILKLQNKEKETIKHEFPKTKS